MLSRAVRRIRPSPLFRRHLFDPSTVQRVSEDVDVCIVGAGPAGLSAAIRLKQLEQQTGKECRVVVLEKGPEVGACSQPALSSFSLARPRLPYSLRRSHRTSSP